MNAIKTLLAVSALALGVAAPLPGFAQAPMDHGAMAMPMAASMTEGEIRRLDAAAGKLTIRHGEIQHLDMPPMTMVFTVKDKTLLDGLRVGDKIRFKVVSDSGQMVVTEIQPLK